MKNLNFWKVTVILLFAINIASIGYLIMQKNGGGKSCCKKEKSCMADKKKCQKGHKKGKSSWFSSKLDLTEEQEESFSEMRKAHYSKIKDVKKDMYDLKVDQFELLKTDPESEKIDSLNKVIGALYQQKMIFTMNHFKEMRTMLNEDQTEKFNDLMDRMQQKMNHKKERGHKKWRK